MKKFLFAFLFVILATTTSALAYTVTYDCGSAPQVDPTEVYQDSVNLDDEFIPKKLVTVCNAATGKIFIGWHVSETNRILPDEHKFTWEYKGDKTLTALWLDIDCGLGTSVGSIDSFKTWYKEGYQNATVPANICKGDYEFTGYLVNGTTDILQPEEETLWPYTTDVTLVAQYAIPSTITYSCGSVAQAEPGVIQTIVKNGDKFYPSSASICDTPTGKIFIGWYVSGTNQLIPQKNDITWNYNTDKTLTALWMDIDCGTGTVAGSVDYLKTWIEKDGSFRLVIPQNICKPAGFSGFGGYLISGTDNVYQPENDLLWSYTTDKTLIAQYVPPTTVTYNCGTATQVGPGVIQDIAVFNEKFIPRDHSVCSDGAGRLFIGWRIDGSNQMLPDTGGYNWQYTDDKTLTALWMDIDCGTGEANNSVQNIETYLSGTTFYMTVPGACVSGNADVLSNYNVVGTGTSVKPYSDIAWPYTTDMSMIAQYETGSVITYNCGSATQIESGIIQDTAVFNSDFAPVYPAMCDAKGKTFIGWLIDGTTQVLPAKTPYTWEYSTDKTLTALWLNIDCSAGSKWMQIDSLSVWREGKESDLFASIPQNVCYGNGNFLGYQVSGTDNVYQPFDSVQWPYTTDMTLIAQWQSPIVVTYDCGSVAPLKPDTLYQNTTFMYQSFWATHFSNVCNPADNKAFVGWRISGTDRLIPQAYLINWEYDTDKTLTAVWADIDCDVGESTGTISSLNAYDWGSFYVSTPDSSWCSAPENEMLNGWRVDGTNDILQGSSTVWWPYTDDVTLVAQYATANTITYDCGSVDPENPDKVTQDSAVFNSKIKTYGSEICDKNTDKLLLGWRIDGTNNVLSRGTEHTWEYDTDKTLTAVWLDVDCGTGTFKSNSYKAFEEKGTFYVDIPQMCVPPTESEKFIGYRVSGTDDVFTEYTAWPYTTDRTIIARYASPYNYRVNGDIVGSATPCTIPGFNQLHVGNNFKIPVANDPVTKTTLNIDFDGQTCYLPMADGAQAGTINVKYNNKTYHAIIPDPNAPEVNP